MYQTDLEVLIKQNIVERDWDKFSTNIARLRKVDPVSSSLLESSALCSQEKLAEARKLLMDLQISLIPTSLQLFRINSQLASICWDLGKTGEAITHVEVLRNMITDTEVTRYLTKLELAKFYNLDGLVSWKIGALKQAAASYSNAISHYSSIGDTSKIAATNVNLGLVHKHLGNFKKALMYFDESIDFFEQHNHKKNLAKALNNKGGVLVNLSKMEEAISIYLRSLEMSRSLGNDHEVSLLLNNIGSIYRERGDVKEADAYYQEGLQISRRLQDPYKIALLLNSMGNSFLQQGNYGKARSHYTEALENAKKSKQRSFVAIISANLAIVLTKLMIFDEAKLAFEHLIEIHEEYPNPKLVIVAYHCLSWIAGIENQRNKSFQYLTTALKLLTTKELPEYESRILLSLVVANITYDFELDIEAYITRLSEIEKSTSSKRISARLEVGNLLLKYYHKELHNDKIILELEHIYYLNTLTYSDKLLYFNIIVGIYLETVRETKEIKFLDQFVGTLQTMIRLARSEFDMMSLIDLLLTSSKYNLFCLKLENARLELNEAKKLAENFNIKYLTDKIRIEIEELAAGTSRWLEIGKDRNAFSRIIEVQDIINFFGGRAGSYFSLPDF